MKLSMVTVALGLIAAACSSAGVYSDIRSEHGQNPMEDPEFQHRMQEFMTPGDAHGELAKGVGTWTVTGTMWMEPGGEPMPMRGTTSVRMLLGGRYLMEEFRSEFMGMPFEGLMLMGYNNLTHEYFSVWLDSMGTGFSLSTGSEGKDGAIRMSGKVQDAVSPEGRPFRSVTRHVGPDEQVLEMFDTLPDGTEWKVMEMVYKR